MQLAVKVQFGRSGHGQLLLCPQRTGPHGLWHTGTARLILIVGSPVEKYKQGPLCNLPGRPIDAPLTHFSLLSSAIIFAS